MRICISASMRFKEEIKHVQKVCEEYGFVCDVPTMELPKEMEIDEMISGLVAEHFEKIDASDVVLVVNPGGYFGNSVKVEIGYAKGKGMRVYFMEKTGSIELDCLADDVVSVEQIGTVLK